MKQFLLPLVLSMVLGSATDSLSAKTQYLDYETGELFTSDDVIKPTIKVTKSADRYSVDCSFTCAIVYNCIDFPDRVWWRIPGFGNSTPTGMPAYPCYFPDFKLPNGFDSAEIVMTECENKEFSYDLTSSIEIVPDCEDPKHEPMVAFDGYLPESVLSIMEYEKHRGMTSVRISICPVQYSYDEHVVRACTSLRFDIIWKVGEAGVDQVATDVDATAEYFNLQGMKVDAPVPGHLYITRRDGICSIEIFH